jgi:hypothetical protein
MLTLVLMICGKLQLNVIIRVLLFRLKMEDKIKEKKRVWLKILLIIVGLEQMHK